jgi:6-phosphogluconolactonase (cycloisomerase 2 family)
VAVVNGQIYLGDSEGGGIDVVSRTGVLQRTIAYPPLITGLGGDDVAGGLPGTHTVVLSPDEIATGRDFGNRGAGEIRGTKFNDLDGDGARDPGEPGLENWRVYLDLNNNRQWDATEPHDATDAEGNYALTGLDPGTYTVAEVPQSGWEQTFPTGTGRLTFVDAYFDGQTYGQAAPIEGMEELESVTVSPDGRHVYTAAISSSSLAVFRRDDATGQLRFVEALFDGQLDGQENLIDGLGGAYAVTVSPDGNHVYVAASGLGDTLTVFSRDTVSGQLTLIETLRDGQVDGQGNPVDGLNNADSVAQSPDGLHLYVAALNDHAVSVFGRNPATGQLAFVEALFLGQTDGQGNPIDALGWAREVTVSPDGSHVYVAAQHSNALTVFRRNRSTGELTLVEVLKDRQPDGQGNPVDGLSSARSVVLSPDGSHVYVAGPGDSALAVFRRDGATGKLTFVEMLKDGQSDGQGNPIDGLSFVDAVAISPDGSDVYAVSLQEDALAAFHRDGLRDDHLVVLGEGEVIPEIDFGNRRIDAPPTVEDVLVRGTDWAPSFLAYLQANGHGDAPYGYRIPVGSAAQLDPLGWVNIDQVSIAFSEDVVVGQGDLTVIGLDVPSYAIGGFAYDGTTFTATWTLSRVISADSLLLRLGDRVTDLAGNLLDGEWEDEVSTYPSGDRLPGGDFAFKWRVLPADADQDGDVARDDFVALKAGFGAKSGAMPITGDFDGDGDSDAFDYVTLKRNTGRSVSAGGAEVLAADETHASGAERQPVAEATAEAPAGEAAAVQQAAALVQTNALRAFLSAQLRPGDLCPVPATPTTSRPLAAAKAARGDLLLSPARKPSIFRAASPIQTVPTQQETREAGPSKLQLTLEEDPLDVLSLSKVLRLDTLST